MFTREGWVGASLAAIFGVGAMAWAGWPIALSGAPLGFVVFAVFAYLRG